MSAEKLEVAFKRFIVQKVKAKEQKKEIVAKYKRPPIRIHEKDNLYGLPDGYKTDKNPDSLIKEILRAFRHDRIKSKFMKLYTKVSSSSS